MIGILIGAAIFAIATKKPQVFAQRATWFDVLAGLAYGYRYTGSNTGLRNWLQGLNLIK